MISTIPKEDEKKASSDEDNLIHYFCCCMPRRAMCGTPLGLEEGVIQGETPEEDDCVVCDQIYPDGCPNCGYSWNSYYCVHGLSEFCQIAEIGHSNGS